MAEAGQGDQPGDPGGVPGGNVALDRLTDLAGPAMHSGWKERNGKPTEAAAAYFKHNARSSKRWKPFVRQKWGIPMETEKPAKVKRKRSGKIDQADRKPRRRIGGGEETVESPKLIGPVEQFPSSSSVNGNVVRRANTMCRKSLEKVCVLPIAEKSS